MGTVSFDPPLTVGVVGVGNVTTTFHLPILSNLATVEVTYVADLDQKRAEAFADIYGTEPVVVAGTQINLPLTDAVLLAIPVGVRDPYIKRFGEMGVALFSEKPYAPDIDSHRRYLNELSAPTACNYMRTTYGTIQQIKTLIRGRAFGHLEGVTMTRGLIGSTGISPGSFRTDSDKSGGGVLMEKGCHDLSQLCEIFRDADIKVIESEITWRGSLDVAVEAVFHISQPYDIPVDYRISMVEPYETATTFQFERATATCQHPEADDVLKLDVPAAERTRADSLAFQQVADAAQSTEEAMYLRWKKFLAALEKDDYDSARATEMSVTRLVTELYEKAGNK